MAAPLMAMALLRGPVRFDRTELEARLVEGDVIACDGDGAQVQISGRLFDLQWPNGPAPRQLFRNVLSQPGRGAATPIIDDHSAHLVVTCSDAGEDFAARVRSAAHLHQLTATFGSAGAALGAYWFSGDRLVPWAEFEAGAATLVAALDPDQAATLPCRQWVTVQMTEAAGRFGGETRGLLPFTGYEVEMTPTQAPLNVISDRMLSLVAYHFNTGMMLEGGDTLGAAEDELAKVHHDKEAQLMRVSPEAGA